MCRLCRYRRYCGAVIPAQLCAFPLNYSRGLYVLVLIIIIIMVLVMGLWSSLSWTRAIAGRLANPGATNIVREIQPKFQVPVL